MVSFLFVILFMALVFGLCFLVDKGAARLIARARAASSVRPPLRYPVLAAALILAAVGCVVFAVVKQSWLYGAAAAVFLAIGVYALVYYRATGISYTDTHFTFRSGKRRRTFAFGDIEGQRVAVAKTGVCLVLCLGAEQVVLYSSMQGFGPFLDSAFQGWCRAKGLDPAGQIWHDPANQQWFPDQPDAIEEEEE